MAVKLMEQKDWDIDLLNKLSVTMNKASICGLDKQLQIHCNVL